MDSKNSNKTPTAPPVAPCPSCAVMHREIIAQFRRLESRLSAMHRKLNEVVEILEQFDGDETIDLGTFRIVNGNIEEEQAE